MIRTNVAGASLSIRERVQLLNNLAAGVATTMSPGTARTTLQYTISLTRIWEHLLEEISPNKDEMTLDIGCGFGLVNFEIGIRFGASSVGCDIVPEFIEGARVIDGHLRSLGAISPEATTMFGYGDICGLPYGDQSFDVIVVREVLQYLPDPSVAVAEIFRVLKPGGRVIVEDLEDDLYIVEPPNPDSFILLHGAIANLQKMKGGNRNVGRRLAPLLHLGGFEVTKVSTLTEGDFVDTTSASYERAFVIDQLTSARSEIIDKGVLTTDEFDSNIEDLKSQPFHPQFRMNGRIAVQARRPR